jgi:hypothetical protein
MLRNAISAFTRAFDTLWRRGALLHTYSLDFVDPGSAEQREDAAPRPGHMARVIPAPHTHAIVSGKLPSATRFLKSVVFKSFTLF